MHERRRHGNRQTWKGWRLNEQGTGRGAGGAARRGEAKEETGSRAQENGGQTEEERARVVRSVVR